ncbi:Ger(x)C family spore germination protein [Alkalihalophilus lindianensis]|uniref:Ger(X)C family spore germination protein n=2 Tax=Alkalihalophilus TaxID=2893060 RepID=A0ABU3X5S1_9BACI|nr:Ger(x)C family spore germination protein [Alkalihalophilus lindianensis]MDV2683229.1 Ger(x)C family spore germination protein [Alkalihalophilus lindianensis]
MIKRCFLLLFCIIIMSGCWDSHYLKDTQLIYSGAFDLEEDGQVKTTVSIPKIEVGVQQSPGARIVSAIGNTVRQSRLRIDQEVSGRLDAAKTRVIIISEDAAKTDIYSYVDVFYRDPRSPLNASIAITKGNAAPYLDLQIENQPLISEYIRDLIDAGEQATILPKTNIQFMCPILFDPGQDVILPYLNIREDSQEIHANQIALFNERKMSSIIGTEESTMLLLLMNKFKRDANFTVKVTNDKNPRLNNYITVQVTNLDHALTVKEDPSGKVHADVNLTLKLNAIEYPEDTFYERDTIVMLNTKLQEHFQEVANRTMQELLEANCDALGIGRELMAYHRDIWKKNENWKEVFPNIEMHAHIKAEIVTHGVIN